MQSLIRTTTLLFIAIAATCVSTFSAPHSKNNVNLEKKDTHELLNSLGMRKLRLPLAHHKKRLAEQGRRHSTGDSRMFVIKLPPNVSYYTHAEPAPAAARTLPLQMKSNGKPARVYHWNLPVLQRLAQSRPQARSDDDSIITQVEGKPSGPKGMMNHPNALDALAYYAPAKKNSFRKYFSSNGKPKGFYVIEKNKEERNRLHCIFVKKSCQ